MSIDRDIREMLDSLKSEGETDTRNGEWAVPRGKHIVDLADALGRRLLVLTSERDKLLEEVDQLRGSLDKAAREVGVLRVLGWQEANHNRSASTSTPADPPG